MKILTANTALGMPGSDSFWGDIHSLYKFHGWKIVPFLLTGERFAGVLGYASNIRRGRFEYFKKHINYEKTLAMIESHSPDVVVLNEIIFQVGNAVLEERLSALGYRYFAWGMSAHHADATVCTLVASRLPAEKVSPGVPQHPQMGGGGGAIAIRLKDMPVTIVGCHLACGVHAFIAEQICALVYFSRAEMKNGRSLVLAGDFNAPDALIEKTGGFEALGLKSFQSNCPVCLPQLFQEECDHIYIPKQWKAEKVEYVPFGSDHLAVVADVHP